MEGRDQRPKRDRRRRGVLHPPAFDESQLKKNKMPEAISTSTPIVKKKEIIDHTAIPDPHMFDNLKRETDEITAISNKKYAKRQIFSTWTKYEPPVWDNEEVTLASDYELLRERCSFGAQVISKVERKWSKRELTKYSELFYPNVSQLSNGLRCLTLCEKLDIPRMRFPHCLLDRMDKETKKNAKTYSQLKNNDELLIKLSKMNPFNNKELKIIVSDMEGDRLKADAREKQRDSILFKVVESSPDIVNTNQELDESRKTKIPSNEFSALKFSCEDEMSDTITLEIDPEVNATHYEHLQFTVHRESPSKEEGAVSVKCEVQSPLPGKCDRYSPPVKCEVESALPVSQPEHVQQNTTEQPHESVSTSEPVIASTCQPDVIPQKTSNEGSGKAHTGRKAKQHKKKGAGFVPEVSKEQIQPIPNKKSKNKQMPKVEKNEVSEPCQTGEQEVMVQKSQNDEQEVMVQTCQNDEQEVMVQIKKNLSKEEMDRLDELDILLGLKEAPVENPDLVRSTNVVTSNIAEDPDNGAMEAATLTTLQSNTVDLEDWLDSVLDD